jgi:uncharacterized protein (DUF1015 family)
VSPIEPFPARIVRPEWAEHVVSPMHDSLTREERAAIRTDRPYSWLHVSRTPDDQPEGEGADPTALAEASAEELRRLVDAGLYEDFSEPRLYIYRLRTPDHTQTGIVGEVPPLAFAEGRVLGHEGVQPDRVDALELHFERVGAESTLVSLMFRADDDVRKVVEAAAQERPLRAFRTGELQQEVWPIVGPEAIERIRERLEPQILYITDGHHRATALVDLWERSGRPEGAGVPAVLFPDEELRMLAFHRRIVGPLGMSPDELLVRLRSTVEVRDGRPDPNARGEVGLYVGGEWYRLVLPADGSGRGVDALDVARLHRHVLEPIFGVGPSGGPSVEFVSAATPVEELTRRVDEDGGAAFTLVAPTFDQFVEVADRREEMPAKATFFDPKPQCGLFLRLRDG